MPAWFSSALASLALFGVWAVLAKVPSMPGALAQALSGLGALPTLLWLLRTRAERLPGANPRGGARLAAAAGLLTGAGNVALYEALLRGGTVAAVVPLTNLYPVVTVALGVLLLREQPGAAQVAGIALALAGGWLIHVETPPGAAASLLLVLLPIGLWGLAAVLQKVSTSRLPAGPATLWFLAGFVPLDLVLLAWAWPATAIPAVEWVCVIGMGAASALGNLALSAAYAGGGKAAVVTPLSSLYPLVAIPIAMAAFGERPSARGLCGVALSLVAVGALAWERRPTPSSSSWEASS